MNIWVWVIQLCCLWEPKWKGEGTSDFFWLTSIGILNHAEPSVFYQHQASFIHQTLIDPDGFHFTISVILLLGWQKGMDYIHSEQLLHRVWRKVPSETDAKQPAVGWQAQAVGNTTCGKAQTMGLIVHIRCHTLTNPTCMGATAKGQLQWLSGQAHTSCWGPHLQEVSMALRGALPATLEFWWACRVQKEAWKSTPWLCSGKAV